MGSPYRALLARSRDRKSLKGPGTRVFFHQRKNQEDLRLLNACKLLYKEKLIERFGFDDVSAKGRIRVDGKWIPASLPVLQKLAAKNEAILASLNHLLAN